MKYIKKEELIEGEIYTHNNGNIVKYQYLNNYDKVCGIHIGNAKSRFTSDLSINEGSFTITELRLATSEEKHWLNTCIKQDKFITFEEAMKTFVPEYVECIEETNLNFYGKLGTIYKVSNWIHSPNDCMLEGTTSGSTDRRRFKPSTKETYDAQFVVKEPEFVLPEKWGVVITEDNRNIINTYRNSLFKGNLNIPCYLNIDRVHLSFSYDGTYYHYNKNNVEKQTNCKLLTFEQFKKYVLKEEIIEEKIIELLPQFKVIETIETITKVENNEGNQFFIGDKVITSLNNIIRIISRFDYNKDKTKLHVYFEETLVVLDINNIEHYVEPKVEIKDEFVLPEKWCIEIKENSKKNICNWFQKNCQNNFNGSYKDILKNGEYIHYPVNSSINSHRGFEIGKIYNNYIEITLDQFKKYILKQ